MGGTGSGTHPEEGMSYRSQEDKDADAVLGCGCLVFAAAVLLILLGFGALVWQQVLA